MRLGPYKNLCFPLTLAHPLAIFRDRPGKVTPSTNKTLRRKVVYVSTFHTSHRTHQPWLHHGRVCSNQHYQFSRVHSSAVQRCPGSDSHRGEQLPLAYLI